MLNKLVLLKPSFHFLLVADRSIVIVFFQSGNFSLLVSTEIADTTRSASQFSDKIRSWRSCAFPVDFRHMVSAAALLIVIQYLYSMSASERQHQHQN